MSPVPYTPGEGGVGTIGETIAEALEIIEVRGRDAIMRQALRQRTPRTQCRRMPRSCDRSSAITRCLPLVITSRTTHTHTHTHTHTFYW